jgi:putative ABC transport system ATP-binding protein
VLTADQHFLCFDVNMLIKARDLHRDYQLGEHHLTVLRGVNLDIEAGEMIALLGRSGSGKSTLLNLIGGLDRPTSGTIEVAGHELSALSRGELSQYRRSTVGFIFQSFNLVPRLKAWENVCLPLVFSGFGRAERRRRAMELLERVGLLERAEHRPSQLSGGEQQRVAVARALVNNPKMLLCDEPTGNLDTATSLEIMGLINQTYRDGNTVLMVTHDPELAERHATRILRMSDGQLEEQPA